VIFAVALGLAGAGPALAQGTAVVLDASESARRAGAERAEAAIRGSLEQAPGDLRAFATGAAALAPRALEHAWGGSSDLIAPIESAASWLASLPGERALVLVSDLELDVVGPDDAPASFLDGLSGDADREQVNEHARELFRARVIPKLRELGARVVIVRLPLPEEARRVSLLEDLESLPGAVVVDAGGAPDSLAAVVGHALPPRPTPTPEPSPSPSPSASPSASPSPRAVAATEAGEEMPLGRRLAGAALVLLAVGLVALGLRSRPKLSEQRLVALGLDGKVQEPAILLREHRTGRARARVALGRGAFEFEATRGGGVRVYPHGALARIEALEVTGAAALVHGMVLDVVSEDGSLRAYLYLDREPNESEKRRAWIEPVEPSPKKRARPKDRSGFVATSKLESISDVVSVNELFVIDESADSVVEGGRPLGHRQVIALDSEGRLDGEPRYLRAHRLDGETAGVELEGQLVSFRVGGSAGATLLPFRKRGGLSVEGVPVGAGGLELVHGMVFEIDGRSFLYLERDPSEPERRRAHRARDTESRRSSIADLHPQDELFLLDESADEGEDPRA
jgi:hypothetical protein